MLVKTAFDVSMGSFWVVFFEKKNRYFLTFSHTGQTFFGAQSIIFQQGCQKELSNFFLTLDIERKSLDLLSKNAARLPRLHSTCLQEQFERNIFLEKSLEFLFFFRKLSKKTSVLYQSLSDEVVKCVFYVSIGKFSQKNFSGEIFKFLNLLRTLTGKNSVFRQAFFGKFEKSAFYVSKDIIWGELFEKKTSLCRF